MEAAEALDQLAWQLDPALMMADAGMVPDAWQADFLRAESPRVLMLCARQVGKSSTVAAKAIHRALFRPGALVIVVAPSLRQSVELHRKVLDLYRALGRPIAVEQESATQLTLANRSRVVALPASPESIRGFSGVDLLVIDEAASVLDPTFNAVTPMLAASKGDLVCLSTPMGRRGFFHREWSEGGPGWTRVKVTAWDCPRIDRAFLEEQRRLLGPRWFRQEHECSFEEAVGQVFATDAVLAAFDSDEAPFFEVA